MLGKDYYALSKELERIAIIPVIKLDQVEDAKPLSEALIKSGLMAAEVTFRTDAAEKSIALITKNFPELLTGAGTVLSIDQAKAAVNAGAKFIVSPGFNPNVVDYCIEEGIPVYPGVNNPTGIEMGIQRGLEVLKFFPAEASGGVNMVKSMAAPYGKMKFMATGGINLNNVLSYLNCPYISACGGSWMVKPDLINEGCFDEIEKLCTDAVNLVKEWRNK